MNRRFAVVLSLIVCGLLGLAACGSAPTSSGGDASRGKEIFQTGGVSGVPCATCHTLDGSTQVGPSLQGIAKRAASRVPGMPTQDYIRQSIENPSAYVVDGFSDQMYKKYGDSLPKQDLDDLVAYLMTQ